MFEILPVLAQIDAAVEPVQPGGVIAGMMILSAGAGSFLFWLMLWTGGERVWQETVLRDLLSPPPEADRFVVPRTAYALGIGIVGMMIALKVVSSFAPASNVELTEGRILSGLGLDLALQLVTYAILGLTVLAGPRPPRWRAIRPEREVLLGLGGFAAAVGPVLLLMIVSQPLRTETSEHQFLQILRDSQSPLVMGLICVSAAVVAPLSEELTYRVILMGGSEAKVGPGVALVGSSLLFAVIHGFPDMIALVPLALILGWIYQRTQSYIAIVTTHAAFNTFNLAMVLVQTWL